MSIPKENFEKQQVNDAISINENGEVVIVDSQLAQALQELSPEELEAVAGGLAEPPIVINNAAHCGVA